MEKGTYDTSEPATSTSGYRTEYGDRVERCGNQRIEPVHGVFPLAVDKLEPGRSPSIKNGTGNQGQDSIKTTNSYLVTFKEDGFSWKQ